MPNPNFLPLIGSSFDQLGNQQLAWAGFNRGVEEGNISRAARAEEVQGNWLAQAAASAQAARERDIQRQLEQDQIDRQTALASRQETIRQSERAQDIALGLGQEARQAALTRESWAVPEKIARLKLEAAQKNQDLALEQHGSNFAQQYAVVTRAKDSAESNLKSLLEKQAEAQKESDALTAKSLKKGWFSGGLTDEDRTRSVALTHELNSYKTSIPSAQKAKAAADTALTRLEAMMSSRGFMPDDEEGHVAHLDTGKTWSFKRLMKRLGAGSTDTTSTESDEVDPETSWAGFTQGTGTNAPVVAPPASATGKRWRWDATAQKLVPSQ